MPPAPPATVSVIIVTFNTRALTFAAMAVFGSVYVAVKTGDGALLWRLNWYFADSFAIVVAGAIVRTHRLSIASRPAKA